MKSFIYINRFFVWKSVCFGHGSGIRYSACLEELNIFSLLTSGNLNTSQICAQWKALVVDWARVLILEVSVKLCRESIFFKLMIFFLAALVRTGAHHYCWSVTVMGYRSGLKWGIENPLFLSELGKWFQMQKNIYPHQTFQVEPFGYLLTIRICFFCAMWIF